MLLLAGHNDAVEALLVASADPNIRNSKSWTAVQSASANGHFEAVLRLVQHGASWRNKADCDVIKTLCRKSTFKSVTCLLRCCLCFLALPAFSPAHSSNMSFYRPQFVHSILGQV